MYVELPAPPPLRSHLACLWVQRVGADRARQLQPVLPDGCVDIVWIGDAPPVVAGPATHAVMVSLPPRASVVGVRFRPGCAHSALGPPADALLNLTLPLAELWQPTALRALEGVVRVRRVDDRLHAVVQGLARRLADAPAPDAAVAAAIAALRGDPAVRVHEVARAVGLSSRQLQRRFDLAVGYGPKTLQRVMRLQRLLAAASALDAQPIHLAQWAAGLGYADQAHMSREVRALANESPRHLVARYRAASAMSDSFNPLIGPAATLRA